MSEFDTKVTFDPEQWLVIIEGYKNVLSLFYLDLHGTFTI
jgi:hypothetical protein